MDGHYGLSILIKLPLSSQKKKMKTPVTQKIISAIFNSQFRFTIKIIESDVTLTGYP